MTITDRNNPANFIASSLIFLSDMPPEETPNATVTYCEVQRGLLLYHIHRTPEGLSLSNAGNYRLTEHVFDTLDAVLAYIDNGESFEEQTNER